MILNTNDKIWGQPKLVCKKRWQLRLISKNISVL